MLPLSSQLKCIQSTQWVAYNPENHILYQKPQTSLKLVLFFSYGCETCSAGLKGHHTGSVNEVPREILIIVSCRCGPERRCLKVSRSKVMKKTKCFIWVSKVLDRLEKKTRLKIFRNKELRKIRKSIFIWVWNVFSHSKGRTQSQGFRE